MPADLPCFRNLAVFQSVHIEKVPTSMRLIGLIDEAIRACVSDADPNSALAKALMEVLCLREEIRRIAARESRNG